MSVVVTIRVDKKLDFEGLSDSLRQPTDMLKALQTFRRNAFYANIATGLDATGKKVKPLSEPYGTVKYKRYGKRPVRVASGEMQASYDSEVMGNTLIESLSSPIAVYHQDGTEKMPQRQLLPESWSDLSSKERKAIESLVTNQLEKVLTRFAQSIR